MWGLMTLESATEWPDLHFKCNVDFCNFTNEPKQKAGYYQCKGCKIGNYTVLASDAENFRTQNVPQRPVHHDQRKLHLHRVAAKSPASSKTRDQERYEKARLEWEEAQKSLEAAAKEEEAARRRAFYVMHVQCSDQRKDSRIKSSNTIPRSKSISPVLRSESQYHTLPRSSGSKKRFPQTQHYTYPNATGHSHEGQPAYRTQAGVYY